MSHWQGARAGRLGGGDAAGEWAREGRGEAAWTQYLALSLQQHSSQRTQLSFATCSQLPLEAPGVSSWSACCSSYNEYGNEAKYGVMRSAKRTQTYWRAGCWYAGGAAGGGAPLARRGTPPTTPLSPPTSRRRSATRRTTLRSYTHVKEHLQTTSREIRYKHRQL